jgi:F-type H+-transporting ATPase subunit alpha
VAEFHQQMVERLHTTAQDALDKMREGDWSDDVQKKLDDAISEFAADFGYDLDEEGQPLSEDAEDEATARSRKRDAEDEDQGDGDDDNGDEAEKKEETAGAAA